MDTHQYISECLTNELFSQIAHKCDILSRDLNRDLNSFQFFAKLNMCYSAPPQMIVLQWTPTSPPSKCPPPPTQVHYHSPHPRPQPLNPIYFLIVPSPATIS